MLDFNSDMNDLNEKFNLKFKDTSMKIKLEIWWEKTEKVVYKAADII